MLVEMLYDDCSLFSDFEQAANLVDKNFEEIHTNNQLDRLETAKQVHR